MPHSLPSDATLLQAAARYLEEELMPTLEGYHRFQTRVSVNVLRMLEREARLRAVPDDTDRAAAIRDGRIDIDTPGLAAQLREELRAALAVNHPGWTGKGDTSP